MTQTEQQKLEELKQKYRGVLNLIEQQNLVRLQNLHIQNGKLFLRGVAPSEEAKNQVWNQIKLIDPTYSDLTVDITVDQSSSAQTERARTAGAGIGGGEQTRTYSVQPGDTLSKISKRFYGDPNQYMRIFEANRGVLKDPDRIQPGQELVIP